jgi:hypothetical protein
MYILSTSEREIVDKYAPAHECKVGLDACHARFITSEKSSRMLVLFSVDVNDFDSLGRFCLQHLLGLHSLIQ